MREEVKRLVAEKLLETSAVKVRPENPFTWASGWHSPFYCDNRRTLSFPEVRGIVRDSLCEAAADFPEFDVVAGVATGAIAQGALVADRLGKPFVYVRPTPKDHGMGNQIEGFLPENSRVLVIEDLISTGGSSLKAVQALRDAGSTIVGMVASFTYGFPTAVKAFSDAGVRLETLTDYETLIQAAVDSGYVKAESLPVLVEWRRNPSEWNV
ncbi:MAG: orotate phosphoribosyltransferase [Bacteroidaceae bacterium]|nr:orotate phosphoribosyltransferase [Bacteroidaceae bacterium]